MRRFTTVFVLSLFALAAAVVVPAASSSGSRTASQASSKVVVIPGFKAPLYPGFKGVPSFPASAPQLAGYSFSQLPVGSVTQAALAQYDTVILYGLRWSTLSSSEQSAINAFARTGKVLIWDADATGAQSYSSFVQPFSTTASGEVLEARNGSVVTFPSGGSNLASSNPNSPSYLDPAVLVSSNHLVQDMSVMNPGAAGWTPALIAANATLPSGGWILAWAYGSATDRTGLVIYSGMDADAFGDPGSPNYALKELQLQLQAGFDRSPSGGPGGTGGGTGGAGGTGGSGGGSGLGAPSSPTFAHCSFAHVPRGWTRSNVYVVVKLGVATGIRGELRTKDGKLLSSVVGLTDGTLRLPLDTRRLPSNRRSLLTVRIFVNAAKACTLTTSVRVDNVPARFRSLKLQRVGHRWRITLRTTEAASVYVWARRTRVRVFKVRGLKTTSVLLRTGPKPTSILLRDRGGNLVLRRF